MMNFLPQTATGFASVGHSGYDIKDSEQIIKKNNTT